VISRTADREGRSRWLWLVFVLVWIPVASRSADAPQVKTGALVRIAAQVNGQVQSGTGFVTPSGDVFTAYHVVFGASHIDIYQEGSSGLDEIEVVAVRPDADLAILRANGLKPGSFYKTEKDPPGLPGSPVYVHGHPLGFENQLLTGHLTQASYMLSERWLDRRGQKLFDVRGIKLIPVDITSEAGVSGSPVVDENGIAFGVFSGSLQAGGAGYSWAIPLLYADQAQMQAIHKAPANIAKWPPFTYLRPGLTLLRSLKTDSQMAGNSLRCSQMIDDYTAAWERVVGAATALQFKMNYVQPQIEAALDPANTADAASTLRTLKFAWGTIAPAMKTFVDAQEKGDGAEGQIAAACASQMLRKSLLPSPLLASRGNILFAKSVNDRFLYVSKGVEQVVAQHAELTKEGNDIRKRIFDLAANSDASNDEGKVRAYRTVWRIVTDYLKGTLSEDQADFVAKGAHYFRMVPEILELAELHEWENELPSYTYRDPAGFVVSLPDGWLVLDNDLREAASITPQLVPDYVQFVQLDVNRQIALLATGEMSWQTAGTPKLPQSESEQRTDLEKRWQLFQSRDEFSASNANYGKRRIAEDVIAEMTGDGQAGALQLRAYSATRIRKQGVLALNCALLVPTLDYKVCSQIMDRTETPH
jgi:Trypsin-like peptidase domain